MHILNRRRVQSSLPKGGVHFHPSYAELSAVVGQCPTQVAASGLQSHSKQF